MSYSIHSLSRQFLAIPFPAIFLRIFPRPQGIQELAEGENRNNIDSSGAGFEAHAKIPFQLFLLGNGAQGFQIPEGGT